MLNSTLVEELGVVYKIVESKVGLHGETYVSAIHFCNQDAAPCEVTVWAVPKNEVPEDCQMQDDKHIIAHVREIPDSNTWYYNDSDTLPLRDGDCMFVRIDTAGTPKVSVTVGTYTQGG